MVNKTLIAQYQKVFHHPPAHFYFAPGRINLIGEHVDYNGGSCLPIAISLGINALVSPLNKPVFKIYSAEYTKQVFTINLDNLTFTQDLFWTNYPKGIIKYIMEKYEIKTGFELYTSSTLPSGAGLSSSAAIEMLLAKIICDYNNITLSPQELARLGQKVENDFIGLKSGILDQFVIATAKKNNAILLNASNLEYNHIPFIIPPEYDLIIAYTNKKRSLATSKYNERVNECQQALEIINIHQKQNYPNISALNINKLDLYEQILPPLLFKRIRHVLTENKRVNDSINYLVNNNFIAFSQLLYPAHLSLRDDYEVTGLELDTLVINAIKLGAIGARMTGAGFGGCGFLISPKNKTAGIKKELAAIYQQKTGLKLVYYDCISNDAVGPIIIK